MLKFDPAGRAWKVSKKVPEVAIFGFVVVPKVKRIILL